MPGCYGKYRIYSTNGKITPVILITIMIVLASCSGSEKQNVSNKINIDLTRFTDDGYRIYPNGDKISANYEFCIPANDSILLFVKSIDPTAEELKGSKGRINCTKNEWLVIGSTRQDGFKSVLKKLANLPYIKKINETFWE